MSAVRETATVRWPLDELDGAAEEWLAECASLGDARLSEAVLSVRAAVRDQVRCDGLVVSLSAEDCAAFLAAVRRDGVPAKSWQVPGDADGAVYDVLCGVRWLLDCLRKLSHRGRSFRPVEVERWCAARGEWLAELRLVAGSRDAVVFWRRRAANLREAVERRRFEDEWAEKRRREEEAELLAAREAAELLQAERDREAEAKQRMRRLVSEDARKRSRLQGYAVLGFDVFQDVRPRWLYVLLGQDGSLYCGSALSLRRRVAAHRRGMGAAVTRDTRQRWHLLHAELLPGGQAALCAEFALLHSESLQDALLAARSPRAAALHERFGCAVPWLGLVAR